MTVLGCTRTCVCVCVCAECVGRDAGPLLEALNEAALYKTGPGPVALTSSLGESLIAFLARQHAALPTPAAQARRHQPAAPVSLQLTVSLCLSVFLPFSVYAKAALVQAVVHGIGRLDVHVGLALHVLRFLQTLPAAPLPPLGATELRALAATLASYDNERSVARRRLVQWHLLPVVVRHTDPARVSPAAVAEYAHAHTHAHMHTHAHTYTHTHTHTHAPWHTGWWEGHPTRGTALIRDGGWLIAFLRCVRATLCWTRRRVRGHGQPHWRGWADR
jgi:hypothetical protein